MSKINRWCFGVILAVLGVGSPLLYADEPLSAVAPAESTVSPDAGAMPSEPGLVPSGPSEMSPTTPGVDNAVQVAQEEVRDPFSMSTPDVPAVAPGPGVPTGPEIKVELQGIGFGSKDAYAVIGGEVFFKGDEKMGIKLLEVRRREADIMVNGGKITVPLFPDQDLKKAKERAKAKGAVNKTPEEPSSENMSGEPSSEAPSSLSTGEQPPL